MTVVPERRETPNGRRDQAEYLVVARAALERERNLLETEVDAFRTFYQRLERIQPDGVEHPTDGAKAMGPPAREPTMESASTAQTLILDSTSCDNSQSLSNVRVAYMETVMAVPHYETEYGDTFQESIADEFGSSLAAILFGGSGLNTSTKDRLLAAVREARESRSSLLSSLDREAQALDEAEHTLHEIEEERVAITSRPFFECDRAELDRLTNDIDNLVDQCESLAARRQTGDLHTTPNLLQSISSPTLTKYLYGDTDHPYPVLSAIADWSERIEVTRRQIQTAKQSLSTL